MVRINEYPKVGIVGGNDAFVIETGTAGTMQLPAGDALYKLIDAAGAYQMHKKVVRGKDLGTSFTADQKTAVQSGTFKDIWLGDYWVINSVTWRVVDINYFPKTGGVFPNNRNHLVIMPDNQIMKSPMYLSTSGYDSGFLGSNYKTSVEPQVDSIINNAFGSANIIEHYPTATTIWDSAKSMWKYGNPRTKSSLPTIMMISGANKHSPIIPSGEIDGGGQFSLFQIDPELGYGKSGSPIGWTWTRDQPSNNQTFVSYYNSGLTQALASTLSQGIRPYFLVG